MEWPFYQGKNVAALVLVGMGKLVELDDTLYEIADLPPKWQVRNTSWHRYVT